MSARLEAALAELAAAIRDEIAAAAVPQAAPEQLLDVREAAAALGIGRTTVYGELEAGRLGSMKVGSRRKIPSSAIAAYIAGRNDGRPPRPWERSGVKPIGQASSR